MPIRFNWLMPLCLIFLVSNSFAQKTGDWMLTAGVSRLGFSNTSLGALNSSASVPSSPSLNSVIAQQINSETAGAQASIGDVSALVIASEYFLTNNIAAEFIFGIPPKLGVNLSTPSFTSNRAISTNVWFPTLMGRYYFLNPSDELRPYVGLGLTQISFHSVNSSNDPNIQPLTGTGASLGSSWSEVYRAGLSYRLDKNWFLDGSASVIPLKTSLNSSGSGTTGAPTNLTYSSNTSGEIKTNVINLNVSFSYLF